MNGNMTEQLIGMMKFCGPATRHDPVARLRAELEECREEILQLKSLLMPVKTLVPGVLNLTATQSRIFSMIANRSPHGVTREALLQVACADAQAGRAMNTLNVHMCNMRRKLARWDIEITTVWGDGFCMPLAARGRLAALLAAERPQ